MSMVVKWARGSSWGFLVTACVLAGTAAVAAVNPWRLVYLHTLDHPFLLWPLMALALVAALTARRQSQTTGKFVSIVVAAAMLWTVAFVAFSSWQKFQWVEVSTVAVSPDGRTELELVTYHGIDAVNQAYRVRSRAGLLSRYGNHLVASCFTQGPDGLPTHLKGPVLARFVSSTSIEVSGEEADGTVSVDPDTMNVDHPLGSDDCAA